MFNRGYQQKAQACLQSCLTQLDREQVWQHVLHRLLTYDQAYRRMIRCGIQILCSQDPYQKSLYRSEHQAAARIDAIYAQSTMSLPEQQAAVIKELKLQHPGWWIFDIGWSNGLLYETMVVFHKYLLAQQMILLKQLGQVRPLESQASVDETSQFLLRRTITLKQMLAAPESSAPIASAQDAITIDPLFLQQGAI